MASFETCTYHSITLQSGEQFNLPPGATIVTVSNPSAITSTNNCADLENLETPVCYFIQVSNGSDGGRTGSLSSVYLKGFYIENTYYPFAAGSIEVGAELYNMLQIPPFFSPTPDINLSRFINEYESVFGTLVFKDFQFETDSDYGSGIWYIIKVPPSIGNNLSIVADSAMANAGSGTGYQPIEVWFNARPMDEWTGRNDPPEGCSAV